MTNTKSYVSALNPDSSDVNVADVSRFAFQLKHFF